MLSNSRAILFGPMSYKHLASSDAMNTPGAQASHFIDASRISGPPLRSGF